jgi:hypothetical protein
MTKSSTRNKNISYKNVISKMKKPARENKARVSTQANQNTSQTKMKQE